MAWRAGLPRMAASLRAEAATPGDAQRPRLSRAPDAAHPARPLDVSAAAKAQTCSKLQELVSAGALHQAVALTLEHHHWLAPADVQPLARALQSSSLIVSAALEAMQRVERESAHQEDDAHAQQLLGAMMPVLSLLRVGLVARHSALVLDVLDQCREVRLPVRTLTTEFLCECADVGPDTLPMALEVHRALVQKGHPAHWRNYAALALLYAQAGEPLAALDVAVESTSENCHSFSAYHAAFDACGNGDPLLAARAVEAMKGLIAISPALTDSVTINRCILVCAAVPNLSSVMWLFHTAREMKLDSFPVYVSAMKACADARGREGLAAAEQVMAAMEQQGMKLEDPLMASYLSLLADNGQAEKALAEYERGMAEGIVQTTMPLAALVAALARSRSADHLQKALMLVQANSHVLTPHMLAPLMQGMAREGLNASALKLVDIAELHDICTPSVYASGIIVCRSAMRLRARARSRPGLSLTSSAVPESDERLLQRAESMYDSALQILRKQPELATSHLFTAMLGVLGLVGGHAPRILQMVAEAREMGRATLPVYSAAVSALAAYKHEVPARKLFHEAMELATRAPARDVMADVPRLFTAMLDLTPRSAPADATQELLELAKRLGVANGYVYTAAIDALGRSAAPNAGALAVAVFEEMRRLADGGRASDASRAGSSGGRGSGSGSGRSGEADVGEGSGSGSGGGSSPSWMMGEGVGDAEQSAGEVGFAETTVRITTHTMGSVIGAVGRSGNVPLALELLAEAQRRRSASIFAYNNALRACWNAAESAVLPAMDIFKQMLQHGLRPDNYTIIVLRHAVLERCRTEEEMDRCVVTLLEMLAGARHLDNATRANLQRRLFEKAQSVGWRPRDTSRWDFLNTRPTDRARSERKPGPRLLLTSVGGRRAEL